MSTKINSTPYIINGGNHIDDRGTVSFINEFSLEKIKRFYIIENSQIDTVRAWQGHKNQPRYFHVVSGSFWVACVRVDDWAEPSKSLIAEVFRLESDKQTSVLYIPPGYANGIKAIDENSKLISFCEDLLDENSDDNYRYDQNMWLDWNNL